MTSGRTTATKAYGPKIAAARRRTRNRPTSLRTARTHFFFCHACSWRGEGSIPQPSTIIGHRHRWCPQHRAKPWVLDIDASNHMTSSRAGFVDLDQDRAFQRWLHHSHRGARSRSVLFSCKNGEHRSLSLHSLPHAAPHSQYNQHRIAR